jgi:citrate synthase
MAKQSLTLTDNRNGQTCDLAIEKDSIRTAELDRVRATPGGPGLLSFDPALRHTATCRSAITYQDPRSGLLWYRGYPIEQLAESSNYLEVAYLILEGELPDAHEFARWQADISDNATVHQSITMFLDGFHHDADPMRVLVSTVAAMATFYPEAEDVDDHDNRRRQIVRLVGQVPTLAAFAHRRRRGMPYAHPDADLSYIGNFLSMMFRTTELRYEPDPVVERALDVLFLLHADHGQACSTTTMRCVGSARTDPYVAAAAAAAALSGRFRRNGLNAVLRMLGEIGSPSGVAAYVEKVKQERLEPAGFGHRLYRAYDPRARILRLEAERLFDVVERPEIFDIALRLDDMATRDPYFIEHALYPIVDFYEAVMYDAMGFPENMFPVLFAIPRFIGWAAQWEEMIGDPLQQTYRPQQIYIGAPARDYLPVDRR